MRTLEAVVACCVAALAGRGLIYPAGHEDVADALSDALAADFAPRHAR